MQSGRSLYLQATTAGLSFQLLSKIILLFDIQFLSGIDRSEKQYLEDTYKEIGLFDQLEL